MDACPVEIPGTLGQPFIQGARCVATGEDEMKAAAGVESLSTANQDTLRGDRMEIGESRKLCKEEI
jgi:hypothetical protein